MKMVLASIALCCSVFPAHAEEWFAGHFGQETCVPIDDIDFLAQNRLYHHSGDVHTPEQLEAKLRGVGAQVEVKKGEKQVDFWIKAPGLDTFLIVFNDEALCQALVAGQPKR
jgi:hypothetical protein